MTPTASVLVVAATARELASGPWRGLICGVGPVEAAAATAAELERSRPLAVLHVGIAGSRRLSALVPGSLVIGSDAQYCDLGVSAEWAPSKIAASSQLLAAARSALPSAAVMTIGTSARVGGTARTQPDRKGGINVEAMEGFAVLRAAALAGVPAIEVRAISNDIEEADRGLWQFDKAFLAITAATPLIVAEIERALRPARA